MATIKKAQLGRLLMRGAGKLASKMLKPSAAEKARREAERAFIRDITSGKIKPNKSASGLFPKDAVPKKSKSVGLFREDQLPKKKQRNGGSTPAWQRKEGKNPSGGLNAKGVASYRAANPGSKLKTAVTTKPSKLKPGSKAANRRKSFCARMSGMKRSRTSAKTANDPNSRINKSLRKWNC